MRDKLFFMMAVFLLSFSSLSYGQNKYKVFYPDLSKTGMIKQGTTYYLQRSDSGDKEIYIGTNKYTNTVGRGQLTFDLSSLSHNDINFSSAKLYLRSSPSDAYNFEGRITLYKGDVLGSAGSGLWENMVTGGKIGEMDMFNPGLVRMFSGSTTLNQYVKDSFGDDVVVNIKHNSETSKGLVLTAKNLADFCLVVNYTEKPTISINGPASVKQGERATYTAYYNGSSTPSTYTWTLSNSNFKIVSTETNKNSIVVEAVGAPSTTSTLKVTAGDATISKTISVSSDVISVTGNITTSQNYSGRIINVSNATISNNITVNMTATERVVITPATHIKSGTKVIIKATGAASGSLANEAHNLDATEIGHNLVMDEPTLYPNPVKDRLTVDLGNSFEAVNYLEVYNLTGVLVSKQLVSNYLETIDVNNYVEGIYILRIVYKNGESEVKRFMVKK